MIEFCVGWLLILAGGCVGQNHLVQVQPTLKTTLHHLEAYRESIGLFNLLISFGSLFHFVSHATTHTYSPLYWFLSISVCILGVSLGLLMSIHFLNPYLIV